MLAFINYPSWMRPEIVSWLPVRWYGLMYLFAFGTAYLIFKYQVKKDSVEYPEKLVGDFIFTAILGLVIGARVFSTLVYHDNFDGLSYTPNYWLQPWLIFWPFRGGQFVGLEGMSYHGGVIGCIIAILIFCKKHKISFRKWGDMLGVAIPLGYTFGRLGNFINGELWGRVTTKPWGMVFPNAVLDRGTSRAEWAKEIAQELGIEALNGRLNLPRHPSQIYEMIFEGFVLFLLLWFVGRRLKKYDGQIIGFYLIGYGAIRFVLEYFRQPDANKGFILGPGRNFNPNYPLELVQSYLNISIGQILCLLMVLIGSALVIIFWLVGKKYGPPVENFVIEEESNSKKSKKGNSKKKSSKKKK